MDPKHTVLFRTSLLKMSRKRNTTDHHPIHCQSLIDLPTDILQYVLPEHLDLVSIVLLRRCCKGLRRAVAVPTVLRGHSFRPLAGQIYEATMDRYFDTLEESLTDKHNLELLLMALVKYRYRRDTFFDYLFKMPYQLLLCSWHFPCFCMRLQLADALFDYVWTIRNIRPFGPAPGERWAEYKQDNIDQVVLTATLCGQVRVLDLLWTHDMHIKKSILEVNAIHPDAYEWCLERRLLGFHYTPTLG
jgi:hypothetical protein